MTSKLDPFFVDIYGSKIDPSASSILAWIRVVSEKSIVRKRFSFRVKMRAIEKESVVSMNSIVLSNFDRASEF